jgi:hypothetical protein
LLPVHGSRSVGPSIPLPGLLGILVDRTEFERVRWDPKDGELCLDRTKPEETLVEVRSDSDVQIDRQI